MKKNVEFLLKVFSNYTEGLMEKNHISALSKPSYLFAQQNFLKVVYNSIVPKSKPRASSQVLSLLPERPSTHSSINFSFLWLPLSHLCHLFKEYTNPSNLPHKCLFYSTSLYCNIKSINQTKDVSWWITWISQHLYYLIYY